MKCVAILTLVMVATVEIESKMFDTCELAHELMKHDNMSISEMKNWLCIAFKASDAMTDYHSSELYGIFRVHSRWWCGLENPGGGCNIKCDQMLTEDITDALRCARLIKSQQGFEAWHFYSYDCVNPTDIPAKCLNDLDSNFEIEKKYEET